MIIGSEPVSIDAITTFNKAFAPVRVAAHRVQTLLRHRRGNAVRRDHRTCRRGDAAYISTASSWAPDMRCASTADAPDAVPQVSCGQVARSQWAVIVDPGPAIELPDGEVGEIWLHGNNVGAATGGCPTKPGARSAPSCGRRSPTAATPTGRRSERTWLRTGDFGVYLDGELYVTGRIADLVTIDGRNHYPQHLEATVAEASRSCAADTSRHLPCRTATLRMPPGSSSSPNGPRAPAVRIHSRRSSQSAQRPRSGTV